MEEDEATKVDQHVNTPSPCLFLFLPRSCASRPFPLARGSVRHMRAAQPEPHRSPRVSSRHKGSRPQAATPTPSQETSFCHSKQPSRRCCPQPHAVRRLSRYGGQRRGKRAERLAFAHLPCRLSFLPCFFSSLSSSFSFGCAMAEEGGALPVLRVLRVQEWQDRPQLIPPPRWVRREAVEGESAI